MDQLKSACPKCGHDLTDCHCSKVLSKKGARRVPVPERLDLICPTAELELSKIYAEGAEKYGEWNWTKDLPAQSTWRHLLRHLNLYRRGDRSEPHLAKAMWGLATLIHYEQSCKCGENLE